MARNGSGTYSLPAGNPVVTGSTISSTWANNTLNDVATALTGSIASDGQTTPSANLPMGGFAHTNVGNATVRAMYATAGQVQDNTAQYLTSVSGTNAITATGAFGLGSYVTGQRFSFIAAATNTGACTININSIGAKAITKNGSTALSAGDMAINGMYEIVYDGTEFQLVSSSAGTVSYATNAGHATTADSATTAGSIANSGGWNITPSGTTLYFNYNGTNIGSLDSSGNLTVIGNIISNGTV